MVNFNAVTSRALSWKKWKLCCYVLLQFEFYLNSLYVHVLNFSICITTQLTWKIKNVQAVSYENNIEFHLILTIKHGKPKEFWTYYMLICMVQWKHLQYPELSISYYWLMTIQGKWGFVLWITSQIVVQSL